MDNILFFVEGVHDANCISRILSLNKFNEVRHIDKLPDIWKNKIPRTYPFVKGRLDRCISIPSYFTNGNVFVVIICSNGESNIIKDIDLYLSNMSKSELELIRSENKVKVGCIANVFHPGSANQSSIRHDEWISEVSINKSIVINKFYNFIVNIIRS